MLLCSFFNIRSYTFHQSWALAKNEVHFPINILLKLFLFISDSNDFPCMCPSINVCLRSHVFSVFK